MPGVRRAEHGQNHGYARAAIECREQTKGSSIRRRLGSSLALHQIHVVRHPKKNPRKQIFQNSTANFLGVSISRIFEFRIMTLLMIQCTTPEFFLRPRKDPERKSGRQSPKIKASSASTNGAFSGGQSQRAIDKNSGGQIRRSNPQQR